MSGASLDNYFQVAVDAPLAYPLTYRASEALPSGQSVIVPLGARKANAVVLGPAEPSKDYIIKNIFSHHPERPIVNEKYLSWFRWLSEYYNHPIGQVLSLAFAPLDEKKSNRKSKKSPIVPEVSHVSAPRLTAQQKKCIDEIHKNLNFQVHLLHGVTGSGKTEVYLQLLEKTLAEGKTGLVLVPEIALTPQLISRFAERFGHQVAVIHSHLTDRERTTQWWSIVDGEKKILVGARSALFCPMKNLGIILIDEEHEASYKQDEQLRYNARDSAIMLAKYFNIPIVLGSATPSLDTWHHVQTGKYLLHSMPDRVSERSLPAIEIVDLKLVKEEKKVPSALALPFWMSKLLYESMVHTLNKNEQVALFLNRRGVAQTVICPDCGFVETCPNCAISLTLHGKSHLVCHYCDYSAKLSTVCSNCKEGEPTSLGIGTEQIENELPKYFPEARIARADRDEIQSREALEELIRKMENREIDILVGTQMIAKGLDFKHLNLVGLIQADVGFNLPDFRSSERSFQLLTQMSGRAGRHSVDPGKVIIQTYNPDFPALKFAQTADYLGFAEYELLARCEMGYPPFGKLAAIRIIAQDKSKGEALSERCADRASQLTKQFQNYSNIQILGPAEAPLAKLRNKYRFHLLLKCPSPTVLSNFCRQLIGDGDWIPRGAKVQVDIDPINMM